MKNYILGSGYIGGDQGREDFYKIWLNNLLLNNDFHPQKGFVICSRGQTPPIEGCFPTLIKLSGDLGHICRDNSQRHQLEGWACDVMILALLAYDNECDFLFIEQDCLPFGNFVTQMYADMGDGDMVTGSSSFMPSANSLFLVRHGFIPQFVNNYLAQKLADRKTGGEDAFAKMGAVFRNRIKRLSFGWDRDRPTHGFESMKGKVWYIQQVSQEELLRLKEIGLI